MKKEFPDLRLDPEARRCPMFDNRSIKMDSLPDEIMGVRVVDNCAEENQK